MATVARRIWLCRNAVVFNLVEISNTQHNMLKMRRKLWRISMRQNIRKNNKEVRKLDTIVPKWVFPPCGVYKINWDAPIDKTEKMMGVGVMVRDYDDKLFEIHKPNK
jgi:hypothetical protein